MALWSNLWSHTEENKMRNVVLETPSLWLFSFYVTVSQVCLLRSYLFKKKKMELIWGMVWRSSETFSTKRAGVHDLVTKHLTRSKLDRLTKADYLAKTELLKTKPKTPKNNNSYQWIPSSGFLRADERKPSQNPVHLTMIFENNKKNWTIPLLLWGASCLLHGLL